MKKREMRPYRKGFVIQGHNQETGAQLPTFFLLADVQGITDMAHAVAIARSIVGPDVVLSVYETSL